MKKEITYSCETQSVTVFFTVVIMDEPVAPPFDYTLIDDKEPTLEFSKSWKSHILVIIKKRIERL